ncbi:MAG: 5-formyltetrahydrofolate cyclo-ligase [Thiogranum sp.]|nr:5-formyltetrahydrofolate cyclo-ligase [Thiogranum sp.]
MTSRSDNRKQLRAHRRALSPREHQQRSRALCRQLINHPLFRTSKRIAVYLPNDGEVDTRLLIERAWDMHKKVYLPVLVPYRENRLWFTRYTPHTRLVNNRFGIPEPEFVHRQRIRTHALDLVLTPLVGFDAQGNRLGMGGGFYDRSLAFLRRRQHWHKPRLVGLAYDFQQLPELAAEVWDVPLSAVVTDVHWHRFEERQE